MVVLFLAGRNVTLHKMAKLNRCRSKLFYSPSSGFRYWLTSLMSFTSDAAIVSVHIGHTVSPDSSKLKTTTTTQTNMFSLIRDYHRTAVPTVGFRRHTMWRVGQSPRWQYPVAKFIFCSMPKLGKKYAENENLGVGVFLKKRWRRHTHMQTFPTSSVRNAEQGRCSLDTRSSPLLSYVDPVIKKSTSLNQFQFLDVGRSILCYNTEEF